MAKFNKFGRDFLNKRRDASPDVVYWAVGYNDQTWQERPLWNAAFNIRVGNTTILLHSNNEENDTNFVKYLWKLYKLESTIKQFIEKAKGEIIGFKSTRTWLNPDDTREEHYFNGYVVTSYDGDSGYARISIADCNRSIIMTINTSPMGNWVKQSNKSTFEKLETIIKHIGLFRAAADAIRKDVEALPLKESEDEPKTKKHKVGRDITVTTF